MRKAFTVFAGFVHDFAAGSWAATVMAVWWLHRITDETLQPALDGLKEEFFYMGLACAALVLLTGAGRTFTYASGVYGAESEGLRKRMLVIKHVVLLAVFGGGIYWQWTMAF